MLGRMRSKMNTKKNKQGVMLVTILFILAIALIFIVSAITLTTATRKRLYTRAKDNQARLTVISAAESFYQAVYMQEITDDDVVKLANAGAELNFVGTTPLPGLSGSDDNCTKAYFSKTSNSVIVDFKTTIDDYTECVQMVFNFVPEPDNPNPFEQLVNVSKGGSFNHVGIGMTTASADGGAGSWTRHPAPNNTLMFRGDSESFSNTGNNYYYSHVLSSSLFTPIDSQFYGNVVLWGANAGVNLAGVSGTPFSLNGNSTVYFMGNTNSFYNGTNPASNSNQPSCNELFKGGSVVFYSYNGSTQTVYLKSNQQLDNGAVPVEEVGTTNNFTNFVPTTTSISAEHSAFAADYLGLPPVSTYCAEHGHDLLSWAGINACCNFPSQAGATAVPATIKSNGGALTPGVYTLSGEMGNGSNFPIITCDVGGASYYFYITSDFTIKSGIFNVINGAGSQHGVYFIICSGQKMTIGTINTNGLAGIVSTNCYGDGTGDASVDFNNNPSGASSYYRGFGNIDNSSSPRAFIYSQGTGGRASLNVNVQGGSTIPAQLCFESNSNAVCTAYIGLMPSRTGAGDDGGVYVYQTPSVKLYGRIACSAFGVSNASQIPIPYCPDPFSDVGSDVPQEVYTEYSIYDYQMYYEGA